MLSQELLGLKEFLHYITIQVLFSTPKLVLVFHSFKSFFSFPFLFHIAQTAPLTAGPCCTIPQVPAADCCPKSVQDHQVLQGLPDLSVSPFNATAKHPKNSKKSREQQHLNIWGAARAAQAAPAAVQKSEPSLLSCPAAALKPWTSSDAQSTAHAPKMWDPRSFWVTFPQLNTQVWDSLG